VVMRSRESAEKARKHTWRSGGVDSQLAAPAPACVEGEWGRGGGVWGWGDDWQVLDFLSPLEALEDMMREGGERQWRWWYEVER
jgi:hypothetical protein